MQKPPQTPAFFHFTNSMDKKAEIIRILKYGSVGIANTLITFLTFTLLRAWGVDENVSNAAGYIAGMVNSFCWNRRWVFRSQAGSRLRQAFWFVTGAGLCWLVQWGFFRLLLAWGMQEHAAYLTGMVVYTALNYLFNKHIAFRHPVTPRQGNGTSDASCTRKKP